MPEGQEHTPNTPLYSKQTAEEHFIPTGIAGQVLTLKHNPELPLMAVRYREMTGDRRWVDLAPTGYTTDGGRNITLISAITRPANVLAAQASAGAATTITVGTAAWVVNAYRGKWIVLTGGTGAGQARRIVSNTATIITVEVAWDTNPDATTTFEVLESNGYGPYNIRVLYQFLEASDLAYDELTGCIRVQEEFPAAYDGEADAIRTELESWSIRSDKDTHFTTAIAQDLDEQENLTGLPSNKVLIENAMLQMDEALDGEIWIYQTDTFDDVDLDIDSFKACICEFFAEEMKRRNNAGQYYLDVSGINKEYEDLDGTKEVHVALVVRNVDGKTAGANGEFVLELSGKRLG